jgi:hypothetical protein
LNCCGFDIPVSNKYQILTDWSCIQICSDSGSGYVHVCSDSISLAHSDSNSRMYSDNSHVFSDSSSPVHSDSSSRVYSDGSQVYSVSNSQVYSDSGSQVYSDSSGQVYSDSSSRLYYNSISQVCSNSNSQPDCDSSIGGLGFYGHPEDLEHCGFSISVRNRFEVLSVCSCLQVCSETGSGHIHICSDIGSQVGSDSSIQVCSDSLSSQVCYDSDSSCQVCSDSISQVGFDSSSGGLGFYDDPEDLDHCGFNISVRNRFEVLSDCIW